MVALLATRLRPSFIQVTKSNQCVCFSAAAAAGIEGGRPGDDQDDEREPPPSENERCCCCGGESEKAVQFVKAARGEESAGDNEPTAEGPDGGGGEHHTQGTAGTVCRGPAGHSWSRSALITFSRVFGSLCPFSAGHKLQCRPRTGPQSSINYGLTSSLNLA